MRFYIMHRGLFEEISASERNNHATFFAAMDRRNLRRVKFFSGKYAADTRPGRIEKALNSCAGKLRIKVCGPAVFWGRPVEMEKIRSNTWGRGGDWYLKTEISPDKLYCYSWVANYPGRDAVCVSFEILKEEKKKK
jgi:hypothetical protein